MEKIRKFFLNMDARAWRAAAITVGLFASVALIFLFGKTQLGMQTEREVEAWLSGFSGSPLALFATIGVFTAAAFVGAPQFLLIAACVVAFGPWEGFFYSWIATVVSAAVTFWAGRLAGAKAVDRFGGATVHRISRFVGRNAFAGSFIIRNVPSAPFIVVNMAFGVSQASFWSFIAGCALGVLPKTLLVAIFGRSVMEMASGGDWRFALLIAAVGFAWLGVMLAARKYLRGRADLADGETE